MDKLQQLQQAAVKHANKNSGGTWATDTRQYDSFIAGVNWVKNYWREQDNQSLFTREQVIALLTFLPNTDSWTGEDWIKWIEENLPTPNK